MARIQAILVVVLIAFAATSAGAGEVLAKEDFAKLDLKKLPAGCLSSGPGNLALVDEPGRGKVLKITNNPDGWPFFGFSLDAAKVKGHTLRVSAFAKFPGAYTPAPGKDWARPRMQLIVTVKDRKELYFDQYPLPGRPDWQHLITTTPIDAQAEKVEAFVRVDLVAAEVFYDDFIVELDPAAASQPPVLSAPAAPAAPAAGIGPAAAPAGAGAPVVNEAAAAKAPLKTIDEGGVIFSPQIALQLQKSVKPGIAVKNSLAFAGPGLPIKELESALPDKWTRVPVGKELTGAAASPRGLMASLPEFLAKEKPEVIVIAAETTQGARKSSSTERYDWEDLARLCQRMGTVPVLAVPPGSSQEGKEDLRSAMLAAATDAQCPVIDLRGMTQAGKRSLAVIDMLEKFVFCRVAPDTAPAGVKKPNETE